MENQKLTRLRYIYYTLAIIIIFFFVVVIARDILIPITLAFLFAILIHPLSELFIKIKFPKPLANILSVLIFVAVFYFAISLLVRQVQSLTDDFPSLKQKAVANLEFMRLFIEERFGVNSSKQHAFLKELVNKLFDTGGAIIAGPVTATANTLFKIVLLPVFMFYLLNFRDRFKHFMVMIVPEQRKKHADSIVSQITLMIQKYISGLFTVVAILCVLNSLGLYLIGLKYAILFGIISASFNLIPYFGTWIGAAFPLIFALLTGDSPRLFISVFLLYLVIQFTENNILTPNITGSYVRINPLMIILGIIIGGMVWGVTGMLVVIPFLAAIKIIFENIDWLKPVAYLLSNDKPLKHGLILKGLKDKLSHLAGPSKSESGDGDNK